MTLARFPSACPLAPLIVARSEAMVPANSATDRSTVVGHRLPMASSGWIGLGLKNTASAESTFSGPCRNPRRNIQSETGKTKELTGVP